MAISALKQEIKPLIDEINARYSQTHEVIKRPLLSNQRQIGCMTQAYEAILRVIELCEMGVELDLINLDLTQCYKHLASIIMPVDEVNVVGEIFSRFCLGK